MKLSKPKAFFLIVILWSGVVAAQVATSTPPLGSFGGGPFDIINLGNLNVHFVIPVVHKAGRGMPFSYDLTYDSSVWTPAGSSGSQTWLPTLDWGWNGSAFRVGHIVPKSTITTIPCTSGKGRSSQVKVYFTYVDSLGTFHPFPGFWGHYSNGCGGQSTTYSGSATASDGSGYTLTATDSTVTSLTDKYAKLINAPVNYPYNTGTSSVTDANGNQISVNNGATFTDTLGVTALTIAGAAPNPKAFTYTAPSGSPASYTMTFKSYTVATNFAVSGVSEYGAQSASLVDKIALPDGTFYSFTYEATPSSPTSGACTPLPNTYLANCVTGRIASVTLPTGGTATYGYTGIESDGSTAGLTRMLSPTTSCGSPPVTGCWQYSRALQAGSPPPGVGSAWITAVVDPSGNNTVMSFAEDSSPATDTTAATYNFYETQRQVYQGSVSPSNLLATTIRCYNAKYANCATYAVWSPIRQLDVYSQLPNGSTRLSELTYNGSGSVTDDKEYDYGVVTGAAPGNTQLVRDTVTSYYLAGINKPSEITVYDSRSGSTVGYIGYTYDAFPAPTTTSGTPQHITPGTYLRGNPTTVQANSGTNAGLIRTYTYYDTGNPNVVTDVNGAQTTYVYGSGSCGNSFPTTVNEPLSLSRSMTWNCVGGVMLTAKDESGNVVSTDYSTDADFWRPDYILDQLQNKTALAYHTNPTATESTLSFNSANSVANLRVTVDGFGRSILSQRAQTPSLAEYDTSETDYNIMGQPGRSTMPFQASAGATSSTAPGTTTTYDALGRPLTVTAGGGGTVSYQYIDNDVLQTVGPTQNFTKQYEYDGLGRLTSVCEVTPGTLAWPGGTCAQTNSKTGYWTKYIYDALGNLLKVTQNAQSSGNTQTRTFTYDELSRLTSETNPETGNSSSGSDITYTYDASCGSYAASAGDVAKRVDKAGNLTCYGHDALHRLTDAGNTGTCRHFRYDTQTPPSGVTVTNTLARQAEAYTDNCSGTKITDEWFGYDADGRLTDVYESTPHSGGYYHTSASYWANGALYQLYGIPSTPGWYYGWLGGAGPGLDGEGRYTRVAAGGSNTDPVPYGSVSYVTSGTTEPIGALTNVSYGSGDSDTFNFDPSTGRKQTYTFSVNSVNDKGTLTWNANGTLGKLVIADGLSGTSDSQTCTYYYDDLARLGGKDSNGYSVDCGSKWSQLFTFDPFGNISKSGTGTFSPTYSTATNQFTAIPGVTVSYDQNGNLLTDNLNTYTWDPNWGNPASINSTKLIYDALGQMVEQQNGSSYTQMLYSPVGKTAIMNGQTLVKAFVSLPGGGTAIYNSSSGSPVYYRHADWLGSSRLTSTASRTVYSDSAYSPYAEQYAPDGTADASFTGQNTDTTSTLYDFTFREHSFTQGRWISPDPAGLRSVDPTSPQSWNRYAYALNNPLSYIDPTGLECVWDDGSYDSNDDPTTGTPASCAKAGGTWVDHSYFQANGLADWSGDPNADIAAYAANNGTKSPARQQCEQKAQQKYANAKAALPGVAGRAGLLGFMVPFWGAAVAGCVGGGLVGGAVGGVGGEAVAGPPGAAAGGTGGFAAGCTAGAVGGMEAAILPSVGTMFVTGGVTYVWEGSVASNDLQIDMAACSQIQ